MGQTRKNMCSLWVIALLALARPAAAQQAGDPPKAASVPPLVQTLEEVRALPPDEEQLDLYKFDNPIKVQPNTFNKSWSPPPSPKEISENGGYLLYGLGLLVGKATKGLHGVPGVRAQVQSAIARPPPLDLEQMDRATRIREAQAQDGIGAAPNE